MNNKLIAFFLSAAVMPTISQAFSGFNGSLGVSTSATDIILMKCSTVPTISVAHAAVRDEVPIVATPPNIRVQIAKATSITTCPSSGASTWTTAQTTTGEGTWSPHTANINVGQTPPNNYYCIKVTKATVVSIADDYQLDHGCAPDPSFSFGYQPSSFINYIQDQ